ncbi:hypothetical protein ACTA71_006778, partial [Dictyostelium dimigraforme]
MKAELLVIVDHKASVNSCQNNLLIQLFEIFRVTTLKEDRNTVAVGEPAAGIRNVVVLTIMIQSFRVSSLSEDILFDNKCKNLSSDGWPVRETIRGGKMENLFYIIMEGVLKSLIVIIGLLIGVAFATLLERKVMAAMQKRRGPNVVGVVGLLQPLADGLKLVLKETIIPIVADKIIYAIAPILTFTISIVLWSVMAVGVQSVFASINSGVIFILAISSIGVYGIILAGWASNSKYAFLGGLRSAAQMVSYEVALGLIILSIITYAGTVNLQEIAENQEKVWFLVPLFPGFLLAFISALAETNRPPFDLPEAEAELVSGYN